MLDLKIAPINDPNKIMEYANQQKSNIHTLKNKPPNIVLIKL